MTSRILLKEFHSTTMDGFDFCKRVNIHYENLVSQPGGSVRIRLRKERPIKKFIEEVVPLANYVRRTYLLGLNLTVSWVDGDQKYDAILRASGTRVERSRSPKRRFIEIVNVMHQNEYLVREHLTENGFAYNSKGMSRDPKTGKTVSSPIVFGGNQHINELSDLIIKGIRKKAEKAYPNGTDLIMQCKADANIRL